CELALQRVVTLELGPVVVGDALGHVAMGIECGDSCPTDRRCIVTLDAANASVSRATVNQSEEHCPATPTDDTVSLPVTELGAIVCSSRSLVSPILTLPGSLGHAAFLEAMVLVSAEAQTVAKKATLFRITQDLLVDGLVTDPDAELEPQAAADLLWAPTQ